MNVTTKRNKQTKNVEWNIEGIDYEAMYTLRLILSRIHLAGFEETKGYEGTYRIRRNEFFLDLTESEISKAFEIMNKLRGNYLRENHKYQE